MLSFETPHFEVDGVVLFPDHDDPLLFYHTAGAPQIAIGPQRRPMFDLWVYTEALVSSFLQGTRIPAEMGGGFLTLGVSCQRSDKELRAARKAIAAAKGLADETAIRLSPIAYTQGRADIIALDAVTFPTGEANPASATPNEGRPRFVTAVVGTGTPALLGDLQSIFSLSLSDRGAAFMAGMFDSGSMPVGVSYALSFEGLSPSVNVTVHADMDMVKRHFGAGLVGQVQWFKADVSAAIDHLIKTNVVTIDSSVFIDSDAAREAEQRVIALFKEDLIQQLFRPTLPTPPQPGAGESIGSAIAALARTSGGAAGGAAGAAGAGSGGSLGLTLKFSEETADLSGTFSYASRMPVTRTDAPQAFLQTMIDPANAASHTTLVNLGTASAFFDRVEAIVSLPDDAMFRDLNLRQAVVSVTYGEGDPARTPETKPPLVCVPGGDRHRIVAFHRNGRASMAIRYAITYEFDDPVGATVDASRYTTQSQLSTTRAVMIDPMGDFGYRRLSLLAGRIPADVTQVDIEADFASESGTFAANRRFRLLAPFNRSMAEVAPDGADWPVRTEERGPGQFTLHTTYVFADASRFTAPEQVLQSLSHTLDAPFQGDRVLRVQPNILSQTIEAIDLEIEYDDAVALYHRRFAATLMPPFAAQTFTWPILNPDRQTTRIRATIREGGIVTVGDWELAEGPTHVVGTDAARPVDLVVRLIGGEMTSLGLDAVLVEVRHRDEAGNPRLTELFFAPTDPVSATTTLIRRPGLPVDFEFRTQAFTASGDVRTSPWIARTETLLLIISLRTL